MGAEPSQAGGHCPAPVAALAVLLIAGLSGVIGYGLGLRHGAAERPAPPTAAVGQPVPGGPVRADTRPPRPAAVAPASTALPAGVDGPVAIDVTRPLRITWPLDVGPEEGAAVTPPPRLCLRARQGVNELQNPGEGQAFYGFEVREGGSYRTWFRVRWGDDGIGSVLCSNSWFAGLDDLPAAEIGNETAERDWFWQRGPDVRLTPGVHGLRVELREDGTAMDRAVLAPAGASLSAAELDAVPVTAVPNLVGLRPPLEPARPLGDVEFAALPTASLAVGAGHTNQVTVCASHQGEPGLPFRGRISVECPTAPGLAVEGDADLACGPAERYARQVLTLRFPADTPRRPHLVTVSVRADSGEVRCRQDLRFVKGPAWAFLGPFGETATGDRRTPALARLYPPAEPDPRLLARCRPAAELAAAGWPAAAAPAAPAWRLVADGSCYDWTGAVDLGRVYGQTSAAFAYAVTWVHAETTLPHRSFVFQADDAGWLWLNGHTAVVLPLDLPREAQRLWTSGPVATGPNPVVVRLTQREGYWGFRFDLVDWHWQGRRGDTVVGLEPDAWPP